MVLGTPHSTTIGGRRLVAGVLGGAKLISQRLQARQLVCARLPETRPRTRLSALSVHVSLSEYWSQHVWEHSRATGGLLGRGHRAVVHGLP